MNINPAEIIVITGSFIKMLVPVIIAAIIIKKLRY
jgi:hypothetical protein